jgi:hypothetical protein
MGIKETPVESIINGIDSTGVILDNHFVYQYVLDIN